MEWEASGARRKGDGGKCDAALSEAVSGQTWEGNTTRG